MKKYFLYLSIFVALTSFILSISSCVDFQPVKGNGIIKKVNLNVGSFDKIEINGLFKVILLQGETEKLELECDENVINYIKHEVKNGKLKINSEKFIHSSHGVILFLTFKNLRFVEISGGVELISNNKLIFDNIVFEASGSSKITSELNCVGIEAELSGNSKAMLSGIAMNADIDLTGSSEFNARELLVDKMNLESSGSSQAKVNVISHLNVDVSGSAKVEYTGEPQIQKQISGSATIKKL